MAKRGLQFSIPEAEIEIKQPMPKPQKTKKNLILSLIPSIVMLGLMVVLRGIIGGDGTFVIYSVCSMGIGIVMSIVTYFYDGKEYISDDAPEALLIRAEINKDLGKMDEYERDRREALSRNPKLENIVM